MNTVICLTGKNINKRRVYEAIKQSLREVKLHKQGKLHLDTWDEYLAKKETEEKKR